MTKEADEISNEGACGVCGLQQDQTHSRRLCPSEPTRCYSDEQRAPCESDVETPQTRAEIAPTASGCVPRGTLQRRTRRIIRLYKWKRWVQQSTRKAPNLGLD